MKPLRQNGTTVRLLRMTAALVAAAACGAAICFAVFLASCSGAARSEKKKIVVTYSILGSLVSDLVGDAFDVIVSIPDGLDPHDWEPSAKDIETIDRAALVVENGLGLEEGMKSALANARARGVRVFTASDHVDPRNIGVADPHIWTDPLAMKAMIDALADAMLTDLRVDLSGRRDDLDSRLASLDAELRASVAAIPAERRVLVTGHESLGYFARRYGFELLGAIVPSLSSQAESSAADLASLKKLIAARGVPAIFTEAGTSGRVAESLAGESRVRAVPLSMHGLPKGGGYAEYLRGLASAIRGGLAP